MFGSVRTNAWEPHYQCLVAWLSVLGSVRTNVWYCQYQNLDLILVLRFNIFLFVLNDFDRLLVALFTLTVESDETYF